MVRSVWYLLNLVVWTLYYSSKAVVAGWLKIPNRPGGVYDECGRRWGVRVLRAAGVTVRTVGMEHIPPDQPIIYVSNHQSLFDILALAATIPGKMRFVAKRELAKVPIFGAALKAAGQIYIDRHNLAKAFDAYQDAAGAVRAGMNAVVFAEGTRSRTGKLLPFKKGPFVFAIASQVPVIPIYCAGTFDILPKGSLRMHPRPITLFYGKPISTDGLVYDDRERLMRQVRAVIESFEAEFKRNEQGGVNAT
jgi:1-acyl-sn-glycerol-3-phosphate acyltransferase